MIAKLRELAERAAKGRWRVSMSGYSVKSDDVDVPIVAAVHRGAQATARDVERWLPSADYIAACSPANILRLIAVAEAAMEWRTSRCGADMSNDYACDGRNHDRTCDHGLAETRLMDTIDALRKGDGA